MNRLDVAWATDSGTHEMPTFRRGVPLAEQQTQELLLPLRPTVEPTRPRLTARVRAIGYLTAATVGAAACYLAEVAS